MSLKDEIDKLIASERALLKKQAAKNREHYDLQTSRFRPLRSALEEMRKAVDPAYVRVELGDDHAAVEVGQTTDNTFHYEIRWEIWPRSKVRLPAQAGEAFLETQPGFSVEEQDMSSDDYEEETHTFDTETEVMQHIVTKTTKRIAQYQHWEAERARIRQERETHP